MRISPLLLPISPETGIIDVEVELTGARITAIAAISNASVNDPVVFSRISPLLLPGPTIEVAQFSTADVEVALTGAQIKGQGESLVGANATITLDAKVTAARAGPFPADLPMYGGPNKRRYLKDRDRRIIIEIDGEFIEVASQEEAEEIFNEIRKQRRIEARKAKMKRASIRKITFDILERSRNK